MLDASVPISEQDLRIISMVEDSGKAMVLVLNKWDLVDEDRRTQLDKEVERHLDQVEWVGDEFHIVMAVKERDVKGMKG